MTTMTESDRKVLGDRIDARMRDFCTAICNGCKQRLTEEDTAKIKTVCAELKTLSGQAFGAKRACIGYQLKDLARMLDSILLGRT